MICGRTIDVHGKNLCVSVIFIIVGLCLTLPMALLR